MTRKKSVESKVVSATGTAVGAQAEGEQPIGPAIEAAMSEAISQAMEEGVTDQDEIRKRMLAARDQVIGSNG